MKPGDVISGPEIDKPGVNTVILDIHERAWQLRNSGWQCAGLVSFLSINISLGSLIIDHGPITVLHWVSGEVIEGERVELGKRAIG